ncbi:hypothetical protein GCM10010909_05900 [Acidocella aquatica]|uniref:Flp family type IVb pilin n=1 Tax=Acidocella aquatica TaxID=1922313 RepID=A0ABQ6A2R0_9PROT|nr:Flp family type IVb pilin [Acidocella aquatica]GLR65912.1 hypothetical protein GCM10010909_05900 [Acidocella aquatica]
MLVSLWAEMQRLRQDRRAVTSIEYVLIASLVATVIIDGATNIGNGLGAAFSDIARGL